jgi:hypothetical protein
MLGPPRISKLLWECHLLRLSCENFQNVVNTRAEKIQNQMETIIKTQPRLRAQPISVGIPILLGDGKSLLRGPEIKIPPSTLEKTFSITPEHIDLWAYAGWIDLRLKNIIKWQNRIQNILDHIDTLPEDIKSSRFDRDRDYWLEQKHIEPGKIVGWLLNTEEQGRRGKE